MLTNEDIFVYIKNERHELMPLIFFAEETGENEHGGKPGSICHPVFGGLRDVRVHVRRNTKADPGS